MGESHNCNSGILGQLEGASWADHLCRLLTVQQAGCLLYVQAPEHPTTLPPPVQAPLSSTPMASPTSLRRRSRRRTDGPVGIYDFGLDSPAYQHIGRATAPLLLICMHTQVFIIIMKYDVDGTAGYVGAWAFSAKDFARGEKLLFVGIPPSTTNTMRHKVSVPWVGHTDMRPTICRSLKKRQPFSTFLACHTHRS